MIQRREARIDEMILVGRPWQLPVNPISAVMSAQDHPANQFAGDRTPRNDDLDDMPEAAPFEVFPSAPISMLMVQARAHVLKIAQSPWTSQHVLVVKLTRQPK
jgi:hypothetical protein